MGSAFNVLDTYKRATAAMDEKLLCDSRLDKERLIDVCVYVNIRIPSS